ncbi:MAG: hypothetical protein A2W19_11780 [Spirochaetes bacterium RBG_16_49_21]|nr:MAG: hypothetical protein A2W19_11780 [Spirochaetes bacterium RBG_16_49_21]
MLNQQSQLWTEKQVREYAQIKSRNKIYNAIAEGLPVIRTGRLVRFRPESVVAFFEGKEQSEAAN